MSVRSLPARPNLDHLKHEAKALFKAIRDGDATARQRAHDAVGDRPVSKLTDAQRIVAREYGFPTWARLRTHVAASRGLDEAVAAFLAAAESQNRPRALQVLATQPRIAAESLHVAATLGLPNDVRRLVDADPVSVRMRAGDPSAEPLSYLCASPFHGESAERDAGLLAAARILLDAGADPNTRDGRNNVPALFGVTGMRSVVPIARLLLDAGANPTDGESVFHAAEHFHEEALDLLLAAGADLDAVGDWGNTPLYFLLRWWDVAHHPRMQQGIRWLLDHGADPNVRSADECETALHVAARRGQDTSIVRALLDHGADVHARRGDGATAWLLAYRGGFDAIMASLEGAGAAPEPLSPRDQLLAACGRGDVETARQLASPTLLVTLKPADFQLLLEAAAAGRDATVDAYLAAGFPVDTADEYRATALHHAALHGHAAIVRALLAARADITLRDHEHNSTPLGWACFGADHVADPTGDYAESVHALLSAGARQKGDEHQPRHVGVRAVLATLGGA